MGMLFCFIPTNIQIQKQIQPQIYTPAKCAHALLFHPHQKYKYKNKYKYTYPQIYTPAKGAHALLFHPHKYTNTKTNTNTNIHTHKYTHLPSVLMLFCFIPTKNT